MDIRTKKDYRQLLLELLRPLRGKYSPAGAGVELSGAGASYGAAVIGLEAFARPLWGLVPFWAGGGRDEEFESLYRRGLAAGSDPRHAEYWGDCGDHDQRFVEMAPIAFGLLLAPGILWDPLTEAEKENLADWLAQINDHQLPRCNWYFFRVLVNLALERRGCPCRRDLLEADLKYLDSCYLENGWYEDGVSRRRDYYSAFAMQYYSLIYACLEQDRDPGRSRSLRARAGLFAEDFIYWFDDRGAALPYGRSLTYRFAQPAFWSAALLVDVQPLSPGMVKGLINRNLRWWLSQPMLQGDGTLSVGYAYPNLCMAERYNAPGSPYWALKLFLFLALPDGHPFWAGGEESLPKLNRLHPVKAAGMLMQHRCSEVTAFVPGLGGSNDLGHFTAKYGKFAYSSVFAFSVGHSSETLAESAPDSMLAFVPEGQERVWVRSTSLSYEIRSRSIYSEWSPLPGITVETEIFPEPEGHRRCHRIRSARTCEVYDCGFAVPALAADEAVRLGGHDILAAGAGYFCSVESVNGDMIPYLIRSSPNTNLNFKNAVIPALRKRIEPGCTVIETRIRTGRTGLRSGYE